MKKTFGYKLAVAALWTLHVFGASALIITVLALCGVRMNWWIGALSVVPGWLIIYGLQWYFTYEHRKSQKTAMEGAKQALKEVLEEMMTEEEQGPEKESENQSEECRFHEGGQCTFGDGLPECVKERTRVGGGVNPKVSLIVSCEDPSVQYLEFSDGLRLIFHEEEYVGWYRCK